MLEFPSWRDPASVKIKIEIDVQPEELRRFLGLPDVAGLQEEIIQFIREKVAADPAGFVLDNLQQLGRSRTVQRLLYGTEEDRGNGRTRRRQSRRKENQDDSTEG
jgi:hypothetical protein